MAHIVFDPSKFTAPKAKPLPIILLLDISGSMNIVTNPDEVRRTGKTGIEDGQKVEYVEGGISRIDALNDAVKRMLAAFTKYERDETEFLISIITFGAETRLVLPPSPASDVRFSNLIANGETPLDQALKIAKNMIEDKSQIPSRSYRPLIILVSDGQPDSGWEVPFNDFIQNGRTSKCDRMALAISKEADREMLKRFVEGTNHDVFESETADQITDFFKFVTMSTVQRTLSQNPNLVPKDSEVTPPPPAQTPDGSEATSGSDDDDDEWVW